MESLPASRRSLWSGRSFSSPGHTNPHLDLHFTKGKRQVASSNIMNYNRKSMFSSQKPLGAPPPLGSLPETSQRPLSLSVSRSLSLSVSQSLSLLVSQSL